MREPLSESARKALDQAQHEARGLNQEFVGTEHLILALLDTHGTITSRVLRQYHVDKDELRTQIRSTLPFSEDPPVVTGSLPLSPRTQRVINDAVVMARQQREPTVSSRLLLLAALSEGGAGALQMMRETGVDAEGLLRALSEKPTEGEA